MPIYSQEFTLIPASEMQACGLGRGSAGAPAVRLAHLTSIAGVFTVSSDTQACFRRAAEEDRIESFALAAD